MRHVQDVLAATEGGEVSSPIKLTMNPFQPGKHVRYMFTHRMLGVIIERVRSGGDWLVRWESGKQLPAYECNMELVDDPNAIERNPDAKQDAKP
jgi:hypothetical protein